MKAKSIFRALIKAARPLFEHDIFTRYDRAYSPPSSGDNYLNNNWWTDQVTSDDHPAKRCDPWFCIMYRPGVSSRNINPAKGCQNCPVQAQTGFSHCVGTPAHDFYRARAEYDRSKADPALAEKRQGHAAEMVKFLEGME